MDKSIFGRADFIDTSGQQETTETLVGRYQKSWRQLEQIVFSAKQLLLCLMGTGWKPQSPQQGAALVYFHKLARHGASMLKICPEPIGSVGDFDRDSAAAISRVIYENYLVLFYCCIEKVSADEWDARNSLLGLRDLVARMQLWQTASSEPAPNQLITQIEKTRESLRQNAFFQSLPQKRQDYLSLGHKAMFLTVEELDGRLGNEKQKPAALYKLLSSSVHTTPGSFRMYGVDDPNEVEQNFDLELSTLAQQFAGYYLNRATIEVKELIPEWSRYTIEAFETYQKLLQRELENEMLSKKRKARRKVAGHPFP